MKLILTAALSTLLLSVPAWAHSRFFTEHAESQSALGCLLTHDRECGLDFVAGAQGASRPWLWWNSTRDLDLGPLVSWHYAGTQAANFYTTRRFNGRTADVYDVKFKRQEKTFYVVPPGPDGKVRYMMVRNGGPDDEIQEFWASK